MTRRRLPTAEKKARGTFRRDREASTPPPRVDGTPKPPAKLKGAALAHWREMTVLLARRYQLTLDSGPALVALCEVFAERQTLARILERDGRVQRVKAVSGSIVTRAHPLVRAYQDADRRYRAWLAEFGLTDASRGKVNALPIRPTPEDDSPPPAGSEPGSRYGLN